MARYWGCLADSKDVSRSIELEFEELADALLKAKEEIASYARAVQKWENRRVPASQLKKGDWVLMEWRFFMNEGDVASMSMGVAGHVQPAAANSYVIAVIMPSMGATLTLGHDDEVIPLTEEEAHRNFFPEFEEGGEEDDE